MLITYNKTYCLLIGVLNKTLTVLFNNYIPLYISKELNLKPNTDR